MARFYGKVGFIKPEESEGSVWTDTEPVERPYYGDLIRHSYRFNATDKVNDDISLNNEVSIVADAFAYENFQYMRYVVINNVKWEIMSVTIDRPRITLTIGGVFNG